MYVIQFSQGVKFSFGFVFIRGVFYPDPGVQFDIVSQQTIMFEAKFIFRFTGIVIHQFGAILVVVGVLLNLVLQGTATENEKIIPAIPVVLVRDADRVAPLHAFRQVIQHVFLVVIRVFHPFIQVIHVVCPDAENRQLVLLVELGFCLELKIVVHG